MEPVSSLQASQAIKAKLKGNNETSFQRVVIDSRQVKKGDLFVAIIGPRNNGHDFLDEVWQQGAVGALVSRPFEPPPGSFVLEVDDTLVGLQELARFNRNKYDLDVIGITGSNGKTTTKDLIAAVLEEKQPTLKTPGNLNNLYGLPLTLLTLAAKHKAAVIEMGISERGEMRRLAEIAMPNIGVFTNIGPAHLETLGTLEGVAEAKAELIDALPDDGLLIYNGDDRLLQKVAARFKGEKISFGFEEGNRVRGQEVKRLGTSHIAFGIYLNGDFHLFRLPLLGKHNAYNALSAIAVGWQMQVDLDTIASGLLAVKTSGRRMAIEEHPQGFTLIDDTYNSNPVSLYNALQILAEVGGDGRKIAVLGDMLELGRAAGKAHKQAGYWVKEQGVDWLITRGEMARIIARSAVEAGMQRHRVLTCNDNKEALQTIKRLVQPKDTFLVKGSRGMAMEEIIKGLGG